MDIALRVNVTIIMFMIIVVMIMFAELDKLHVTKTMVG